jgi:ABC-2 type transport system permease protein
LRWTTPLGWVEELQPLTTPRPLVLVPIVGLVAALSGVTVYLAGRRDLGASTIADRVRPNGHTRLLAGPQGLTLRLVRPAAIGWIVAIALAGLMMGLIAKSAGAALMSSTQARTLFSILGAHGGGASAYLGVAFLIVAVLVALVAAEQISGARGEEATGRLEHLLVRETSRTWWYVGRLLVAVVVLAIAGLAAGLSAWAGAAAQDSGVGLVGMLAAGINLVPPSVLLLGFGALVLGWAPRTAPGAVYALVAWSFLVELIGGIVGINHWVLDTSVFHQMATAPATAPNWSTAGILVGLGAVAAILGGIGFRRRDLAEA